MPIAKEEALRLAKKIEKEDRREGVINVELVALRVFEKDYMRMGRERLGRERGYNGCLITVSLTAGNLNSQ